MSDLHECITIAKENGYTEFARAAEKQLADLSGTTTAQAARIEELEKALTSIAQTCNIELYEVEGLARAELTDDAQVIYDIQKIADEARNG